MLAFHLVPPDMRGTVIYPLNMLADQYPDIYTRQVKKHVCNGRLRGRRIPLLNCLWGDVVFLTAIPPAEQRDIYRRVEVMRRFLPASFRAYAIDLRELDPDRLAIMVCESEFEDFDPTCFADYATVSGAAIDYFRSCREEAEPPYRFGRMTSILYRGSIDISSAPIVDAE